MKKTAPVKALVACGAMAAAIVACGGGGGGNAAGPAQSPASTPKVGASCARTRAAGPKPASLPRAGATVVVATQGERTFAYVADEDEQAIHVVDVDRPADKPLASAPLEGRPAQLLFLPDGRLVVALRDHAQLEVLEPTEQGGLEARCAVDTDVEPYGLALTPNDATLLVTHGWGRSLVAMDAKSPTFARSFEVALPREPRSVVVADDGGRAFVSHTVGGAVSVVDLELKRVASTPTHMTDEVARKTQKMGRSLSSFGFRFGREGASCQGFALAKTEAPVGRILAPQVLVDPGDTRQQTSGYGSSESDQAEVSDVAVLDAVSGDVLPTSLEAPSGSLARSMRATDAHDHDECLLPRAAAFDGKTQSLLVACLGLDAVIAYDGLATSPIRAEKRRWPVAAGPTGIAVEPVKHRAVVWSQFDHAISTFSLEGPELVDEKLQKTPKPERIAIPYDPKHQPTMALALGRILFHSVGDTRISHDGRACASCHPDGRDDALTWATPNGPRRSISLAGRISATAPFSWTGSEHELKEHMGITFERLKGAGGLKSMELDALAAYVEALPPPPLPKRAKDAKATRGQAIFASAAAECSTCHKGEGTTDNKHHDVQSKTVSDKAPAGFNTPSLKFVGGGGPYFHDGRYKTLRDLLTDSDRKMGHTKQLSNDDLEALEAYLRTL
jgi:mono/diheme cytochrome c family protein